MTTTLIADSGSTKTDWALLCPTGTQTFTTAGLNPYHMSATELQRALREELAPHLEGRNPQAVYFYGAGCTPQAIPAMQQALELQLPGARVEVADDLVAAARALLGNRPGIAAILGTGANSCLYDGHRPTLHTPPMGYILGDEGSGAYLGKRLVADMGKGLVDKELDDAFATETGLTMADVLQRVYRAPLPGRFLAGLVPFIASHRAHEQIKSLLETSFMAFFTRNIAPYGRRELPVNFVGGIAHIFAPELRQAAVQAGFRVGRIEQRPMPSLVAYHGGREA